MQLRTAGLVLNLALLACGSSDEPERVQSESDILLAAAAAIREHVPPDRRMVVHPDWLADPDSSSLAPEVLQALQGIGIPVATDAAIRDTTLAVLVFGRVRGAPRSGEVPLYVELYLPTAYGAHGQDFLLIERCADACDIVVEPSGTTSYAGSQEQPQDSL